MDEQKRVDCLRCQPGGNLHAQHSSTCPLYLTLVKEQLASVKLLVADIERHVSAGAIVKASNGAMELETSVARLFDMTHAMAFPKTLPSGKSCYKCNGGKIGNQTMHLDNCPEICSHRYGKTEVQGGGNSCNNCGDFC